MPAFQDCRLIFFVFFLLDLFYLYGVLCAHGSALCVTGVCRGEERASDPLELGLRMIESCPVHAGN